jgi:hypothetical protein
MLRPLTIAAPAIFALTVVLVAAEGQVFTRALLAQESEQTEPAEVLQQFQDTLNRGDVDGAMRVVDNDIRFTGVPDCPQRDPCVGADAFRSEFNTFASGEVHHTPVGTDLVSGTTVRMNVLTTSPGRTAIGVDRTLSQVTADVVHGKIVSYRAEPDRHDAQTLWWLNHGACAEPGHSFA